MKHPTDHHSDTPAKSGQNMGERRQLFRSVAFFLQIGWSVVVPIVVMSWLSAWLCNRFDIGPWLMIVGILVGLLTAVAGFIRTLRAAIANLPQDEDRGGQNTKNENEADRGSADSTRPAETENETEKEKKP